MAANTSKKKNNDGVEDLYVEPPLAYRLFPTLMKGRKPSEKALAKAAEKAKQAPTKIKGHLPIADLLPMALVIEVKKRSVARAFYLLWALSFALIGAGWTLLGLNLTQVNEDLAAAQNELTQTQAAYAKVAPYVSYTKDVAEQGAFANTQALDQLDLSASFQIIDRAVRPIGSLTGYTASYGASAEGGTCSAVNGGGGLFEDGGESAQGGIGCLTFTATTTQIDALDGVAQALLANDGVLGVSVKPGGGVDEAGNITVNGEVLVGEPFRIKPGGGVTVDLSAITPAAEAAAPAPAATDAPTATEGATP